MQWNFEHVVIKYSIVANKSAVADAGHYVNRFSTVQQYLCPSTFVGSFLSLSLLVEEMELGLICDLLSCRLL